MQEQGRGDAGGGRSISTSRSEQAEPEHLQRAKFMCLSSPANIATRQWSIGLERNPVFGASRQLMRNRLNRLQTRSEAGDGGRVPLEFAIRQVGDVEVSDPAECRASELEIGRAHV